MDEHHLKIDQFIRECKAIQLENARKIIKIVESISIKSSNSFAAQVQKIQSNCKVLEK